MPEQLTFDDHRKRTGRGGPREGAGRPPIDGWKPKDWVAPEDRAGPREVAEPRSWLLKKGWRRRGLVHPAEVPGRAA